MKDGESWPCPPVSLIHPLWTTLWMLMYLQLVRCSWRKPVQRAAWHMFWGRKAAMMDTDAFQTLKTSPTPAYALPAHVVFRFVFLPGRPWTACFQESGVPFRAWTPQVPRSRPANTKVRIWWVEGCMKRPAHDLLPTKHIGSGHICCTKTRLKTTGVGWWGNQVKICCVIFNQKISCVAKQS